MYDDPANITLPEDSQFPVQLAVTKADLKVLNNANAKLRAATGLMNGIIASTIFWIPIIALVIWL